MAECAQVRIDNLTAEEGSWIKQAFACLQELENSDEEDIPDLLAKAEVLGVSYFVSGRDIVGYSVETIGGAMVLRDDNGHWDREGAISFIAAFLHRFRPDETVELAVGWNDEDGPPGGYQTTIGEDGEEPAAPVTGSSANAAWVIWTAEDIQNTHYGLTRNEAKAILRENQGRIEAAMSDAGSEMIAKCIEEYLEKKEVKPAGLA